jgi:hypothetical protein
MNIMKGTPMRSQISKQRTLRQWLLRGVMVIGMPSFAIVACSSEPGTGSDDDTGACNGADLGSDELNCGSCGTACTATEACVGGTCRLNCVAPQIDCGGVCAATASNSLHCGGCNMACASGEICQNSMCVTGSCPAGTSSCNGACVDTQTNPLSCGASCSACLAGQSCQAGVCVGGGTGGSGGSGPTGGSGGSGPTGGTDSGGTAGSSTGGTAGSSTGGSAGSSTGGTAGSSTGGTAGSATGGTAGGGSTGECRVWLATNGNDSNPGTEAMPVLTLLKAYDLMCPMQANVENGTECAGPAPRTICVKSGTYAMNTRLEFRKTRMGTMNNRLILQGAPGVTLAQRPVFDFATQARLGCGDNPDNIGGLTVNAHFVTVKNLVVRNANDSCILVQGTQGLIENVLTHGCADTGIQISSGGEYMGTGTNNTVRNCDSHSNNDTQCDSENADGFAIKEGTGTGNVFTGCRAWNNADDGYDFYGWTSPVRLENSWAVDQSRTTEGSGSDGNGFKLGGNNVSAAHTLSALFATGNLNGSNGDGFTRNSNPASMSCSGCASWGNTDNGADGISGLPGTAPSGATVAKMIADAARNADGSLKAANSL